MLHPTASATLPIAQDRVVRRQQIRQALRDGADELLERMADALVDLPDDQWFGQIEYTLRDLGHDLATHAHQAGLDASKKRGTSAPASSARIARPMPALSTTAPRPS